MGLEVKCVPVLDRLGCCCCSCDIKIAACVLGWLELIGFIGSFLDGVIGLVMLRDLKDGRQEGFPMSSDDKDSNLEIKKARIYLDAVMIGIVISCAVGILIVSLLLYGAHSKKPGFMLPYLIFHMITTVILALAVVGASIVLFFITILGGLIVLVVGGLLVVLSSLVWVITYSYYRKLEEQRHPPTASPLVNITG